MRKVTTASVMVDGFKVYRDCRDDDEASLWIRYMTAQYMGRVASPAITHTTYSDIFNTPVISTHSPGRETIQEKQRVSHLHP